MNIRDKTIDNLTKANTQFVNQSGVDDRSVRISENKVGVDHRVVKISENDRETGTDRHTVKATERLTGKRATSLDSQVSSVKKQRSSISAKTGDTLTMENVKGTQPTRRNNIVIEFAN